MNSEMLFAAMSDISDEYIAEAARSDGLRKKIEVRRKSVFGITAVAACLAVVIGLGVGLPLGFMNTTAPSDNMNSGGVPNSPGTPDHGQDEVGGIGSVLSNYFGSVELASMSNGEIVLNIVIENISDSFGWDYCVMGYENDVAFVIAPTRPQYGSAQYIAASEVFTVTVNGDPRDDCTLPNEIGEYRVVIDYSRLTDEFGNIALYRMEVGDLKFVLS